MKNPTNATNLGGKTIGVSIPAPTVNQDEGKALIVNSSGTGLTFGEAGSVDDVVNSAGQSVVTNKIAHLPSGTVQLQDQSVTFVANTDNATKDEYPYRASVTLSGVTSSTYAEIVYSNDQATSLNYAPYVDTTTDTIYIYSRTNVGTVTIPTISIGMDYSDITIDSAPTSGSGNAVSSGGVYTNCVRTSGNQTVAGQKTFTDTLTLRNSFPQNYLDNPSDDYTTSYTSVYTKYYIALRDKNQLAVAHISNYVYNGGRGLSISAFDKSSGSVKEANIGLVVPKSSAPYVTATYRTYNSANTSDVVTIGHLESYTKVFTYKGNLYYYSDANGSLSTDGWVSYVRIGPKKGYLSIGCKFTANTTATLNNNFTYLRTGDIQSKLGVTFKSNFETFTGVWENSLNNNIPPQYGQFVCINTSNNQIYLGRVYDNASGLQWGGWPWSTLAGSSVTISSVYVEEA